MKRNQIRFSVIVLLAILLALTLTSCTGQRQSLWLKAPSWNRAVLLGQSALNDPVSIAEGVDGKLYAFLISKVEGQQVAQIVVLNQQADVEERLTLDAEIQHGDLPTIVSFDERILLHWLDGGQLMAAEFDGKGLTAEPQLLSADLNVSSYSVAQTGDDLSLWFSSGRRDPGVFAIDFEGSWQDYQLIDSAGTAPSVAYDDQGDLHALWLQYPMGAPTARFIYAHFDSETVGAVVATEVASEAISASSELIGPRLGLTAEQVYVLWAIEVKTGLEANTISSKFVHFQLSDGSDISAVADLKLPGTSELDYEEWDEDDLLVGRRVAASSHLLGNDAREITPLSTGASELPIAVRLTTQYRWRKTAPQVAMAYLEDGALSSFQLLSFTANTSNMATPFSDGSGHLHLTWIEYSGGLFNAYFTSTDPRFEEGLSHIGADDARQLGVDTLFGLLVGSMLAPFAVLVWLIPAGFLYAITKFMRSRTQSLTHPGTIISLLLSAAGYWMAKLLSLPGIKSYVPFSAWLPISDPTVELILRYGTPVAITLVAIWITHRLTRKSGRDSLFHLLMIYGLADGIMTMAVYGILIFGTF